VYITGTAPINGSFGASHRKVKASPSPPGWPPKGSFWWDSLPEDRLACPPHVRRSLLRGAVGSMMSLRTPRFLGACPRFWGGEAIPTPKGADCFASFASPRFKDTFFYRQGAKNAKKANQRSPVVPARSNEAKSQGTGTPSQYEGTGAVCPCPRT